MNKKSYIPKYKDAIKWKRPKSQEQVGLFPLDITDEDIKNADISKLKSLLKICEQNLKSLQNEHCPQPSDENFGGPASQWGVKHHNDIQVCKRQIDVIKTKIKEFNIKER